MQSHRMETDSEAIIEELFPSSVSRDETSRQTIRGKEKGPLDLAKKLLLMTDAIKISIWRDRRHVATFPVVYGGLAAVLFPFLSLLSFLSLLALNCKIVVEKKS